MDLTFHAIVRRGRRYADAGFCIDVQLKSTTEASVVVTDTEIGYDLEIKAYDDLRDPVGRNRILVLVVFPAEESLWTTQTEEHLLIRLLRYWLSLRGRPPTSNQRHHRRSLASTCCRWTASRPSSRGFGKEKPCEHHGLG